MQRLIKVIYCCFMQYANRQMIASFNLIVNLSYSLLYSIRKEGIHLLYNTKKG